MSSHPVARGQRDLPTAFGPVHIDDPGLDDLRLAIMQRLRHTLADVDGVTCRLDRHGPDITVHLAGPPISTMRRNAVAVRVLDAVRSIGRTYGHVDLDYAVAGDGPFPEA
jgi:hypothetical protein